MSTDHDPKAKAEDVYGKANAAMLKGVPALMAIPVIRSACDDVERQYLEVKQAEKTHSEYTEDKDTIIEKMRAALAGKGGVDPSSPVKRKIVGEVSKYDRTVHNLVGQIANLKEGLEYLRLKLQDELAAQKAKKEEEEKAKKVAAVDAELMGLLAELEAEHALDEESHIHTINSDDTAHTDNKDDPSKKLLIDFVSKVGPSTPSDGSNVAVDDSSPFSSPSEGSPPWKEKTLAAAQSEPPRDDENASVSKKLTLETTGKFSLGNAGANGNVGGTLETPSSTKKAAIKKPGDDLETPASARKAATKNAAAKKAGDDLGTPSSAKKPSGASTSGALANLINLDDLMTENHPNKNAGMPLRATTTTKDATGTGRLLGGPPVDIVVDPDSEGDDAVSQLSMGTGAQNLELLENAVNALCDKISTADWESMTLEDFKKEFSICKPIFEAFADSKLSASVLTDFSLEILGALYETSDDVENGGKDHNTGFSGSEAAKSIRENVQDGYFHKVYVKDSGPVYVFPLKSPSAHFTCTKNAKKGKKSTICHPVGRAIIYLGLQSKNCCNECINPDEEKFRALFSAKK